MDKIIRNILVVCFLWISLSGLAQNDRISNDVVSYKKHEVTKGVVFDFNKEREELLTDESKFDEERTVMSGKFRLQNKKWNLLDYKQEQLFFNLEVGPYGGYGDWIDSTKVENIKADQDLYGIRTSLSVDYLYRYYYDTKNYTIFNVNAWGRYDLFKQNLNGTSIDSLGAVTTIDESETKDRFRYGINAKAGWGSGRLSPMNHLMTAHYLLEKYYPGRVFSDYEIAQFAQVIARLKHNRDYKIGYIQEKEAEELVDFIKNKLMLTSPETIGSDWQYGEFDPRYEGNRVEVGPHFSYYNREPDFLFGGYFQYDNAKYVNVNWNRNFSVGVVYNRYTKQDFEVIENTLYNRNTSRDWATADVNLGWSYFPNLKTQFDFGVRYVPGIELNNFDEIGSVSHNVIPYLAYFTQLNKRSRMKFDLSWRIADGEQFVLPGPEFSLAIYRSNY